MKKKNDFTAVDFHENIVTEFDSKYSKSKSFRQRFQVWDSLFKKYLDVNMSVLDLGCGTGVFSFLVAEISSKIVGIDGSEKMISYCKQLAKTNKVENVEFQVMEIPSDLEKISSNFNIIYSSSVFEYLDNLEITLSECNKLLKDDGFLIVSVPNSDSIFRKVEKVSFKLFKFPNYFSFVKHTFNYDEFKSKFKDSGFELVEIDYYGSTGVILFLARLFFSYRFTNNLMVGVFRKC